MRTPLVYPFIVLYCTIWPKLVILTKFDRLCSLFYDMKLTNVLSMSLLGALTVQHLPKGQEVVFGSTLHFGNVGPQQFVSGLTVHDVFKPLF